MKPFVSRIVPFWVLEIDSSGTIDAMNRNNTRTTTTTTTLHDSFVEFQITIAASASLLLHII